MVFVIGVKNVVTDCRGKGVEYRRGRFRLLTKYIFVRILHQLIENQLQFKKEKDTLRLYE